MQTDPTTPLSQGEVSIPWDLAPAQTAIISRQFMCCERPLQTDPLRSDYPFPLPILRDASFVTIFAMSSYPQHRTLRQEPKFFYGHGFILPGNEGFCREYKLFFLVFSFNPNYLIWPRMTSQCRTPISCDWAKIAKCSSPRLSGHLVPSLDSARGLTTVQTTLVNLGGQYTNLIM